MNEMDGSPKLFSGKNDHMSTKIPSNPTKEMLQRKYYTEFKQDGITKWKTLTEVNQASGAFTVSFPDVQWQSLVQSLSSTEALQWQAWIVGEFFISEDQTLIEITCVGINTYWVDEKGPISADQYSNRPYRYSLKLNHGPHAIKSLVRGKHQAQVKCDVKNTKQRKESRLIASIDQDRIPDIIDNDLASNVVGVTIENLSPTETIKIMKVAAVNSDKTESGSNLHMTASMEDRFSSPKILPNQVFILPVQISMEEIHFSKELNCNQNDAIDFTLKVYYTFSLNDNVGKQEEQKVNVNGKFRCRSRGSSFQFTFIDSDGSIQHAAAIHPILEETSTKIVEKAPVLLALHGTGVSASSSADSYKYKKKQNSKDYTFGIEGFWVLAPTRHGAHNWEGVGKNTAMSALRALSELTKSMNPRADSENVIFAGHSMGAHGAWILGTSFPDLALAVIPQAGWTTKETYGDSNTLFLHDLQSSFLDSRFKSIIQSTVDDNGCELHVSNLKGIPCLARVGAIDQVVHPWWTRRMVRLLHELYDDEKLGSKYIFYNEIPSKEHWWWDTKKENDGGVTNDAELRKFFKRIRNIHEDRTKGCQKILFGDTFELIVHNPSSVGSKHGLSIIQQLKSLQKSSLSVFASFGKETTEAQYVINTLNSRRLSINPKKINDYFNCENNIDSLGLQIDGSNFIVNAKADTMEFCIENDTSRKWKECHERSSKERYPSSYGPLRQVFESTFKIVYGTTGNESTTKQYLDWSIYLANNWYMSGDATVEILSDDFEAPFSSNVLLIGGPDTNKWTKLLLHENQTTIDFGFETDSVRIGPCEFSGNVGLLSMFPIQSSTKDNIYLGAVVAGTTLGSMHDIIMLAKPTIPPMTRQPFSNTYPDFIVTGDETYHKGVGGFLAAGFWSYDWKYDDRSSYVSYCTPIRNEKSNDINGNDRKIEL